MKTRQRTFQIAAIAAMLQLLPAVSVNAADGTLTDAERGRLVRLLEDSRAETDRLIAATSKAGWATRPAPEKWSVAEVVEHLAMAEARIQSLCRRALDAPANPEWASIAESGIDGVLRQLADRSQTLTAPEALEPSGTLGREATIARYHDARSETLTWVRTTDAPVKRHTAAGPPGDLNVEQWFALIAAHNMRHNRQIEDVLAVIAD